MRTVAKNLARALVMAGLAWSYAESAEPVDAVCASKCKSTTGTKGECIDIGCVEGGLNPKDCAVTGPCQCTFYEKC
jgi:hypothetical protein